MQNNGILAQYKKNEGTIYAVMFYCCGCCITGIINGLICFIARGQFAVLLTTINSTNFAVTHLTVNSMTSFLQIATITNILVAIFNFLYVVFGLVALITRYKLYPKIIVVLIIILFGLHLATIITYGVEFASYFKQFGQICSANAFTDDSLASVFSGIGVIYVIYYLIGSILPLMILYHMENLLKSLGHRT
ncbi:hypothetical protein ACOME3_004667 [Neoechinorhynchus agilis]